MAYKWLELSQKQFYNYVIFNKHFPGGSGCKNLPAMLESWVWSLGWENPLEKGTVTHSSIPAWRSPWTEGPGRLSSMGLIGSVHNWEIWLTNTEHLLYTFCWFACLQNTHSHRVVRGGCHLLPSFPLISWVFPGKEINKLKENLSISKLLKEDT